MRFLKLHFSKDGIFSSQMQSITNLFKCHKHQLRSGDAQALFPIDRRKCLLFMIKTGGDSVTERTFQQQLHHQEKFSSTITIIGLGKCFFFL